MGLLYYQLLISIVKDAMTATITKEANAWKLPDLDTVYHCEELGPMTLGQMLDGVDPDLVPSDQTMYEDLLWPSGPGTRWKR